MTPIEIAKMIDKKYSVSIPYKKVWREIARELIFENIEEL